MRITAIRTPLFTPGESLVAFVKKHIRTVKEGDIIVVTSKIAALSQGRSVALKNAQEKERWILRESTRAVKTPWCLLTEKNGEWCANAGVDESNADGNLILLPQGLQPFARTHLRTFQRHFRKKNIGLLITDTRIYPMRKGTMGAVVGYAGFFPLKNYIGVPDLFGRPLKRTQTNLVNALAVSAVLVMGEGSERTPLAVISGAPVIFTDKPIPSVGSLAVSPGDDLYAAVYAKRSPSRARSSGRRRKR